MSKKNTETTASNEGSTRWWEFYAVRYAMGTVVGAIVIYLLCREAPLAQLLTTSKIAQPIELSDVQLGLLAIYGLVYCYIASAPILVLHAGRFLFAKGNKAPNKWRIAIACFIISVVVMYLFIPLNLTPAEKLMYFSVGSLVLTLFLIEGAIVFAALTERTQLYNFYATLAEKRKNAEGGIKDSYRHLREHGNSFFIVLLEILLGIFLIGIKQIVGQSAILPSPETAYLLILIAWILPAVFVWAIGIAFEIEFIGLVRSPKSK